MRRAAYLAGAVGVALAIGAPFALGGRDTYAALRHVDAIVLWQLAAVAGISGLAKAAKLHLLVSRLDRRLQFRRSLAISLATDFAFLASPAGAAGYVVNAALLRSAGASWSGSTAAVAAEQALDWIFFAIAVPLAAFASLAMLAIVLPGFSPSGVAVPVAAIGFLALACWPLRSRIGSAALGWARTIPWWESRLDGLSRHIAEVGRQTKFLLAGSLSSAIVLMLLTAVQWLTRYGVLWFVLKQLGHQLPLGFLMVVQATALHVAQWTGVPAGGGGADVALATVLHHWIPLSSMAIVLLLWRFATLYVPLVVGAICLLVLGQTGRRIENKWD